ncbi:hypothetical protein B566_EDAN013993 [Ephemera danica]|nr:hypothetical protein B566_EDAN013993 [Ephemera danica]
MDPTCSTGNPSASHVADETELYEETELDQSCCTSYLALQVAKETELHIATEQNHVERMKELIDRDRSLLNTRDRDGKTSLHVACEMDNTEAVECLLNYPDCLVDIADNCEKYALHYAAENGNVDNMKLLLNREAKVSEILNKLDVNGETALYLACKYGRTEAVELLLSHPRCLVNVGSEKLPLHCAAGNGYVEILKLLLEWDSTLLNKQDKDGETALHLACAVGNDEIVYSLLNFEGLDLNLTDKWGNTCFHTAALSKVCDILSALLSQKPDLQNKINKKGRTALHIAASIRNDTVIKYLLNLENCDVNVQDINGDTPLHLYVNAYKRTHFDIQNTDINVFKQKCSSLVDKGNKDGDTPLHKAVMVADHESVNKLIEMSANKDMKNNNGQTPVDLAYNLVDSFEKIPILSYFKIATNGDI